MRMTISESESSRGGAETKAVALLHLLSPPRPNRCCCYHCQSAERTPPAPSPLPPNPTPCLHLHHHRCHYSQTRSLSQKTTTPRSCCCHRYSHRYSHRLNPRRIPIHPTHPKNLCHLNRPSRPHVLPPQHLTHPSRRQLLRPLGPISPHSANRLHRPTSRRRKSRRKSRSLNCPSRRCSPNRSS